MQSVDVSNMSELARLAEEVKKTREPRVLTRDDEAVAVLVPVKASGLSVKRKRGYLTAQDSFWDIVGMSDAKEGPTDVSENKYQYLAEAYAPKPG